MKGQRDTLMSYLVTLGFVIFLLLFLSSLVFLSRFVFSEDSQIGSYVNSTQNLLREVEQVQEEVFRENLTQNNSYIKFPKNTQVEDMSALEIKDGKSFVTFKITKSTFIENSTLYFKPTHRDEIREGDEVLLNSGEKVYVFYSGEQNSVFTFFDVENQENFQGNFKQIRGVKLYAIKEKD